MDRLKGKVDPEVVAVISQLAEMQYALDRGLGEIAVMLNKTIDVLPGMMQVAENMKKVIDAHRLPQDDLQG